MIVKIQNTMEGYLFFDNVEEFSHNRYFLKGKEKTVKIEKELPLQIENNMDAEILCGDKSFYNVVYFRQKSRRFRIKTDRPVYLLNDEGKTIEKIN